MLRSFEKFLTLKIGGFLERQSRWFHFILGLVLMGLIAFVDLLTGHEIDLTIFYLLPIALALWYGGQQLGQLFCLLSVAAWFLADFPHPHRPTVLAASVMVRLAFSILFASLLWRFREELERVSQLARTDPLTGAANGRAFRERTELEVQRMHRSGRPLSLAYIDLDNFKAVNDQQGHTAGDWLLCRVVHTFREHTRSTDLVARLGGDEFAVLLPETSAEGSRACLEKLHQLLQQDMEERGWPVTVSIGVVTFEHPLSTVDAMVQCADRLMYTAKQHGKNRVLHDVVAEVAEPALH
jgi:diguanylate cyclase (GGDEF)-like protein